jgi:hypothetical protein
LPLLGVGNGDGHIPGASSVDAGKQGPVHGVERNAVVCEPLRHVPHMVGIIIVEVLSRSEDLDLTYPGGQNLIQDVRVQALLHEEISGEGEVH